MSDDNEDTIARREMWRRIHPLLRRVVIAVLVEQKAKLQLDDALNTARDHAMVSVLSQIPGMVAVGASQGIAATQTASAGSRASIDNTFEFAIDWLGDGLDEDEKAFRDSVEQP